MDYENQQISPKKISDKKSSGKKSYGRKKLSDEMDIDYQENQQISPKNKKDIKQPNVRFTRSTAHQNETEFV
jgi:hypothetical protein